MIKKYFRDDPTCVPQVEAEYEPEPETGLFLIFIKKTLFTTLSI